MVDFLYRVEIDSERDWTFNNPQDDISNYLESLSWNFGLQEPFRSIATPASMQLKLHNFNGDLDLDNSSALYYDKMRAGTLVRVSIWDGDEYVVRAVMKMKPPVPKIEGLDKKLYIEATDILSRFLDMEFVAPLQTNVRIDEALDLLHASDKAIYPYESYYQFAGHTSIGDGKGPFYGPDFTDFEDSVTTLLFIGDNLGRENKLRVQNYVRDAVDAEMNAIFFFDCRGEKFKFLNRNHATETDVSWVLIDSFEAVYAKPDKYMCNLFTVNYFPRRIGAEGTLLYESDSVPIRINARATQKLTLRYKDADNPSAAVGALDVLMPVVGTDIIANSAEDGSGEDWSRFLILSLVKGAASSELTIFNRKRGDPAYITSLSLYGTPIVIENKESITEINDDSIFRHERMPDYKNLYAVSSLDDAQAFARFMVDSFGEPRDMIETLTVYATEENGAQVIHRTIGDVITVIDNQKGHEDDYMIVGERHRALPMQGLHAVTYTLRSTGSGSLFTLGTSYYDEGDVVGL